MNILDNINRLIQESSGLKIKIKSKTGKEEKTKRMIMELYRKYPKIPKFYNEIEIDAKVIPNSYHNNITVHPRYDTEVSLLELLVHEQMHIFVKEWATKYLNSPKYIDVPIEDKGEFLFPDYMDNGEPSFYNHIIVNWNTRNWMKQNLETNQESLEHDKLWSPYPKTEALVRRDWNKIKKILEEHNLIYK